MGEFLVLIWIVGSVLAIIPIGKFIAEDMGGGDKPDRGDIVIGVGIAMCFSWAWPLGIIGVPLYYAIKHWE